MIAATITSATSMMKNYGRATRHDTSPKPPTGPTRTLVKVMLSAHKNSVTVITGRRIAANIAKLPELLSKVLTDVLHRASNLCGTAYFFATSNQRAGAMLSLVGLVPESPLTAGSDALPNAV